MGNVGGNGIGEPTAEIGERCLEIRAAVDEVGLDGLGSEDVVIGLEGVGEKVEKRRREVARAGQREGGPFHWDSELTSSKSRIRVWSHH